MVNLIKTILLFTDRDMEATGSLRDTVTALLYDRLLDIEDAAVFTESSDNHYADYEGIE